MDVVVLVLEIVKCIGAPICKCMNNHMRLYDYMKELTEKQAKLNRLEEHIKQQLDAELRVQKVPKGTVKEWLDDVEKIKREIESIKEKVKEGKWFRRSCLAKLVVQETQKVDELLKQEVCADGLCTNKPPSRGLKLPTKELVGEIEARDKILSYLRDDKVAKIGVHGLGGVGKTAIMEHVNNQLLIEAKFDYVFWVTVPEDHEVYGIQSAIAKLLDESITGLDETIRRGETMRILEDKKFVLILDGMWKQFDLEYIGISESLLNNERKLVLTTRKKKVCESMGCTTVEVTTFPVAEARSLFSKKVGFDIFNDRGLESIANRVLGKCGGSPLAISVVGGAMRDVDDVQIWRAALNELTQGNWSDMEVNVLVPLKFSYDQLGNVKVQQCFLYCSRYPEGKEIPKKELIDDWISKGYVNVGGRGQANLDKGHAILSELENNGLLEKYGDGDSSVKMHPLIRDLALYIRSHAETVYNNPRRG